MSDDNNRNVFELAAELLREHPGVTPRDALRSAKVIVDIRGSIYAVRSKQKIDSSTKVLRSEPTATDGKQKFLEITAEILWESPGMNLRAVLNKAKIVARIRRSIHKVPSNQRSHRGRTVPRSNIATIDNKMTRGKRPSKNKVPEHIRRNILRREQAEQERMACGRKLPTARFVSGGKVSPR